MAAIDTIASYDTTAGDSYAAGTMASGDSATVRNAPQTASVELLAAFYDDVTTPEPFRVLSPALVDNVRGLEFHPPASAPRSLLPASPRQKLQPQDTLSFEFTTAASTGKALAALLIYYSQLPGIDGQFFMPGDIGGITAFIKPVFVTIPHASIQAGAWLDTAVSHTEDILKANTDFAVLGYSCQTAIATVGIKGVSTGNLRCSGPGTSTVEFTANWFADLSVGSGLPTIPVFNSADVDNTYVSIITSTAPSADFDVVLYLAQLSQRLTH